MVAQPGSGRPRLHGAGGEGEAAPASGRWLRGTPGQGGVSPVISSLYTAGTSPSGRGGTPDPYHCPLGR